MIKRIVTLLTVLIFLLAGCNILDSNLNWKEEAQKLVDIFDNKDIESAKNLFSKDIKDSSELTKQLESAFEFYNSKAVETEYNNVSGSYQKDDIDYREEDVEINIKTKDTTFVFIVSICTLHSDSKLVGIRELTISKENDSDNFVFVGNSDIKI